MSANTLSPRIDPSTSRVAAPTLQRFAVVATESDGVSPASLSAIDQLEVRTRNSLHGITLLDCASPRYDRIRGVRRTGQPESGDGV